MELINIIIILFLLFLPKCSFLLIQDCFLFKFFLHFFPSYFLLSTSLTFLHNSSLTHWKHQFRQIHKDFTIYTVPSRDLHLNKERQDKNTAIVSKIWFCSETEHKYKDSKSHWPKIQYRELTRNQRSRKKTTNCLTQERIISIDNESTLASYLLQHYITVTENIPAST